MKSSSPSPTMAAARRPARFTSTSPALPAPYGHALYTCEWGREAVFRHPLAAQGAGFKAGQEPFVMLPRPTDIDIDGQSRIFISSWRGATFTYAGPNVGYIIRLTQAGDTHPPFPNLKAARRSDRLSLTSPHRARSFVSPRSVRSCAGASNPPSMRSLEALASADGPLAPRVAAIFALEQLLGRESIGTLVKLAARSHGARVRPACLRGSQGGCGIHSHATVCRRSDGFQSPSPTSGGRGPGPIGQGRGGRGPRRRTADGDPLVAHVAVKALAALNAATACLTASPLHTDAGPGAARALQEMHSSQAVDGLIAKLATSRDAATRRLAFRRCAGWTTARPTTSATGGRPVRIQAAPITSPSRGP